MSDDGCEMASGSNINANEYLNVLMTYSNLVIKNVPIEIFKGKKNLGILSRIHLPLLMAANVHMCCISFIGFSSFLASD